MDRIAEVLDVLDGHDPCDGADGEHMVFVPTTALVRHRFCRQYSRQSICRLLASRTESQV
jgi:hypothetical protein